jgi:hypothetical protein
MCSVNAKQPTPETPQPSRWRGVYWYMSQDFKKRYGLDAGKPPTPGAWRRRNYNPPTNAAG